MERKNSTTSIVEAGIMAAIVVVLMLMAAYVPVLGTLSAFILPIPITILVIRHNVKIALASLVASTVLAAMLLDPISAVSVLVLYGAIGLSLGFSIKKNNSAVVSVVIQAAAAAVGIVISSAMYIYLLLGSNLRAVMQSTIDTFKESMSMVTDMYSNMGAATDMSKLTEAMNLINVDFMLKVIAPILIFYAFAIAYINYNITKQVFKRMKISIPSLPPFTRWYIDNRITAVLIIIICLGIILISKGVTLGEYFYIGGFYAIQLMFSILGISAVAYFLKNKFTVNNFLIVMIVLFTFLSFQIIYMLIGIIDNILDMRNLDSNSIRRALSRKSEKK